MCSDRFVKEKCVEKGMLRESIKVRKGNYNEETFVVCGRKEHLIE